MAPHYRFHHLGIPTDKVKLNERFGDTFNMYTADHPSEFRIQFHRFESDSPLYLLIHKYPPIALQVDKLLDAFEGKLVFVGPYEPIPGYKVAIINDSGMPIELIETHLSIEELWTMAQQQEDLQIDEVSKLEKDT